MFQLIISFISGILTIGTGYYVYTSIKIRKSYIVVRKRFDGLRQQNNKRYSDIIQQSMHVKALFKKLNEKVDSLDLKSINELKDMILGLEKKVEKLEKKLNTQDLTNRDIFKVLSQVNGKLNALKEDPKFLNRY